MFRQLRIKGVLACICLLAVSSIGIAKVSGTSIFQRNASPSSLTSGNGLENAPWPKYHGNLANTALGASGATGVVDLKVKEPASLYSPAIGPDGTIYVGGQDDIVRAIDPSTGSAVWSTAIGGYPSTVPALGANGILYVAASDYTMYALDQTTGAIDWTYNTSGSIDSSPAIEADGSVVFASSFNYVYSLNGATGAVNWQFSTAYPSYDSPAIDANGAVYLGDDIGDFYALDGSTGSLIWQNSDFSGGRIRNAAAIGSDGTVYLAGPTAIEALDPSTGVAKWSVSGSPTNASPGIGPDGTLYYFDQSTGVVALDPATGNKLWSKSMYPQSDLAIGSDGTIYFGDQFEHFDALDSAGNVKWYLPSELTLNAPAIGSDGSVYFTDGFNNLVKIGTTSFSAFYVSPPTIIGSGSARGVIRMTAAAPSNGYTVTLSTTSGYLYLPSTPITIPGGSTAVSFPITASQNGSTQSATITATVGALQTQTSVNLVPNEITNFYASPSTVQGGLGTYCVVQLTGPAGSSDAATIQSNNPDVQVPYLLSFHPGSTGASFLATTSPVSSPESVMLTATFRGSSLQIMVTLNPAPISNLYLSPASVIGGHSTRGVVQLGGKAGPYGNQINLQSYNTDATSAATVIVPAGATGASFAISTKVVSASENFSFVASFGSSSQSATLTLNPAPIANFYISPSSISGGASSRGVIQLGGPVGAGGDVVSVQSSSTTVVVPSSVTVPSGSTGVSFPITSSQVPGSQTVTLTATLGPSTAQATLTLNPVAITLYFAPDSVTGGATTRGVVQLSIPAGSGGAVVSLTCTDPNVMIPASVTVPQGSTGVSFLVQTNPVTSSEQATISATSGSSSQSATLTLNP